MRDAFTTNERIAATAACAVLAISSLLVGPTAAAVACWGIAVGIAAALRIRRPGNRSLAVTWIDTITMHLIVGAGAYAISSGVMTLAGGQFDLTDGRGIIAAPCLDAMRLVWTRNPKLWPNGHAGPGKQPAPDQIAG